MIRYWLLATIAIRLLHAQAVMQAPGGNPESTYIRQLYMSLCSRCHGADGSGGLGPDLRAKTFFKAPVDSTLLEIIADGIPQSGMPPTQGLSMSELIALARYVRTFSQVQPAEPPGNPLRGERLFREDGGCLKCHMVRGKGGRLGPELTGIGRQRTPAQLRKALLAPSETIPPDFTMVTTTARNGEKISGVLIEEDTFTLRIRDAAGRLHGLDLSELADVRYEKDKSPMPSYRSTMTSSEIDDLVAYLASLNGVL